MIYCWSKFGDRLPHLPNVVIHTLAVLSFISFCYGLTITYYLKNSSFTSSFTSSLKWHLTSPHYKIWRWSLVCCPISFFMDLRPNTVRNVQVSSSKYFLHSLITFNMAFLSPHSFQKDSACPTAFKRIHHSVLLA